MSVIARALGRAAFYASHPQSAIRVYKYRKLW